jgi:hypothetical protein
MFTTHAMAAKGKKRVAYTASRLSQQWSTNPERVNEIVVVGEVCDLFNEVDSTFLRSFWIRSLRQRRRLAGVKGPSFMVLS